MLTAVTGENLADIVYEVHYQQTSRLLDWNPNNVHEICINRRRDIYSPVIKHKCAFITFTIVWLCRR